MDMLMDINGNKPRIEIAPIRTDINEKTIAENDCILVNGYDLPFINRLLREYIWFFCHNVGQSNDHNRGWCEAQYNKSDVFQKS